MGVFDTTPPRSKGPRPPRDGDFVEVNDFAAYDPVRRPSHYNQAGIECLDALKAALGPNGFKAYCRGNALKYLWRCEYKSHYEEDLRKAIFYLRCAIGEDPRS
jgi:hypothetical protein